MGSAVFITGTFGIYALGQTGETPGNKRPDSPADAGNSAFSQCEESASSFPPFVALRLAGSKNGLTGKVEEEEEGGGGGGGEQAQGQDEMGAEDASLGIEAGSGDVDTGSGARRAEETTGTMGGMGNPDEMGGIEESGGTGVEGGIEEGCGRRFEGTEGREGRERDS